MQSPPQSTPQTVLSIVRSRTLSEEVASRLRVAIRNGELTTGTRLVEQETAHRLGVSRVPVREAIQILVDEGLVRKSPHRGAYVYLPTRKEIDEIASLRLVLECFVVERAIERWNAAGEAALRQIVEEMRLGMEAGDSQVMYEQDVAYHHKLWEIADHAILLEIVSSLRSRISRVLYESTAAFASIDRGEPVQMQDHIEGHDRLIDILASGDVKAAKDEMTNHIIRGKLRILTYCTFAPDDAEEAEGAEED